MPPTIDNGGLTGIPPQARKLTPKTMRWQKENHRLIFDFTDFEIFAHYLPGPVVAPRPRSQKGPSASMIVLSCIDLDHGLSDGGNWILADRSLERPD